MSNIALVLALLWGCASNEQADLVQSPQAMGGGARRTALPGDLGDRVEGSVEVCNEGKGKGGVSTVTLQGADADAFEVLDGTLTADAWTLDFDLPRKSCDSFAIGLTAVTEGDYIAEAVIETDSGTVTTQITGVVYPLAAYTPVAIAFADASMEATAVLENRAAVDLTVEALRVEASGGEAITVTGVATGEVLAPGDQRTLTLTRSEGGAAGSGIVALDATYAGETADLGGTSTLPYSWGVQTGTGTGTTGTDVWELVPNGSFEEPALIAWSAADPNVPDWTTAVAFWPGPADFEQIDPLVAPADGSQAATLDFGTGIAETDVPVQVGESYRLRFAAALSARAYGPVQVVGSFGGQPFASGDLGVAPGVWVDYETPSPVVATGSTLHIQIQWDADVTGWAFIDNVRLVTTL